MKNKEIEELLNRLKEVTNSKKLSSTYGITNKNWQLLLSYIEQLKTDYKEANESIAWWINRYNAIVKQNDDNHKKVVKLENNRDKAIEVIDLITPELWNISNAMTYKLKDIKYILKGGSDE